GNPVRYCEGEVTFEIDGDCRLLATDNGANRSRDGYDSPTCLTHQGRCLLILQSTRTFGEISVKATGAGIESETTRIQVHQMPRDPA
ncbi:MAG: hypothetical protein HN712_13080, partial [Gemmatimonadetes bacterium]|nr:hypothetical protein [Gemmatimonadota bacterium]